MKEIQEMDHDRTLYERVTTGEHSEPTTYLGNSDSSLDLTTGELCESQPDTPSSYRAIALGALRQLARTARDVDVRREAEKLLRQIEPPAVEEKT